MVGFVPIALCVEVIVIWLCALSLLCRGDCCFDLVPCHLCRGGCWREELCTLYLILANSSVEVSCVGIMKILLCEGGDVEHGSNIEIYLGVCI